MGSKFLDSSLSLEDLTNGEGKLFVDSITIDSLQGLMPVKTDSDKKLISSNLSIDDVTGLQQELDLAITNPYNGTLKATDFESDNIPSYDATVQSLVGSNASKVSKTDTTSQSIVSDLILSDNTKKLTSENIQTEHIKSLDETSEVHLTNKQVDILADNNILLRADNSSSIESVSVFGDFVVNNVYATDTKIRFTGVDTTRLFHDTDNLSYLMSTIDAQQKFEFATDKGVIYDHNYTADEFTFRKTVKTTKTNFTGDDELINKEYVDDSIANVSVNVSDKISKTDIASQSMASTLQITNNTPSSNPVTGALLVQGGMGIVGKIFCADDISTEGDFNLGGNIFVDGKTGLIPNIGVGGGGNNLFCGSNAGGAINSSAVNNTSFGFENFQSLTSGTRNSAFGYNALKVVSTGRGNTAMGQFAIPILTTGEFNTGVGNNCLSSLTEGENNTAVGLNAAASLSTGNHNTCIGSLSNCSALLDNQIALGYQATTTAANQCVIGNNALLQVQSDGFRDLDTVNSVDLRVGGTNASKVEIGKSGAITEVMGVMVVDGSFQNNGAYGLISAVSADIDDNGISTASTFKTNSNPYNAFDQIINTFWQSGSDTYERSTNNYLGSVSTIVDGVAQLGEWVQIALKNVLLTDKISLRATTKAPLSWVLAGSMDGSTWFTLKDETNVQLTGTYHDATFTTTKTKYVRLIVRLVKNDNYPQTTVDNLNIYGTPILTIEDGVLSGEINASTIHSGFIRTHHLLADNVITDYVDSPNVSKIAKISFPRNENNSALGFYNDDYIGLGWDGSRDFRMRVQSSSYTGVYASGIVPEDSALYQSSTKNRLLTNGFQIYFRINTGTTGFVMLDITSSDDAYFPSYKIIFRINTATTTDIVNCVIERYE